MQYNQKHFNSILIGKHSSHVYSHYISDFTAKFPSQQAFWITGQYKGSSHELSYWASCVDSGKENSLLTVKTYS